MPARSEYFKEATLCTRPGQSSHGPLTCKTLRAQQSSPRDDDILHPVANVINKLHGGLKSSRTIVTMSLLHAAGLWEEKVVLYVTPALLALRCFSVHLRGNHGIVSTGRHSCMLGKQDMLSTPVWEQKQD